MENRGFFFRESLWLRQSSLLLLLFAKLFPASLNYFLF